MAPSTALDEGRFRLGLHRQYVFGRVQGLLPAILMERTKTISGALPRSCWSGSAGKAQLATAPTKPQAQSKVHPRSPVWMGSVFPVPIQYIYAGFHWIRYICWRISWRKTAMETSLEQWLADVNDADLVLVATVVVLCEIAHADKDYSDSERVSIEGSVAAVFGAETSRVASLVDMAQHLRKSSPDLVYLSRCLKQKLATPHERLAVVKAVWQVVLADGIVDGMEARLAQSVSMLLGIGFRQVEEIRDELKSSVTPALN